MCCDKNDLKSNKNTRFNLTSGFDSRGSHRTIFCLLKYENLIELRKMRDLLHEVSRFSIEVLGLETK